jgi:hypothetical protein
VSRLERKIKRGQAKKRKKELERDLNEKLSLYERMAQQCFVCYAPFDKNNKKLMQEWYVVVRDNDAPVNIYCPACWNAGIKKLKEIEHESR